MRYLAGGAALRQQNAVAVISTLRASREPITLSELAARTGLSRPTVDAVSSELGTGRVRRLTEPTAPGARGGRPARTVGFDADAGRVAGIDVGSRRIRVVVTDLAGRVLHRAADRLPPGPVADGDRAGLVRSAVTEALRSTGRGVRDLCGAALAVPGIIGAEGQLAESLAVPDWVGLRIGRDLARGWRCPVAIENDIKLAALAEHQTSRPTPVDHDDLAYLQLGHRVSLALVIDGRIRQGRHRLAGELGTLRGMRWTSTSRRGQLRWRTEPTGRELFAAAAAGGPAAVAEVDAFCAEIAPTIATVLLAVDPGRLVVGGGLSRAGSTLLDPLRRALHGQFTTTDRPDVVASRLGADAAVVGALGLAFDHSSERINGLAGVPPPWRRWDAPDASGHVTRQLTHQLSQTTKDHLDRKAAR